MFQTCQTALKGNNKFTTMSINDCFLRGGTSTLHFSDEYTSFLSKTWRKPGVKKKTLFVSV